MNLYTTNENFSRNVLSVVCSAGLLRILLEFERGTILLEDLDLYLDVSYGILFLVTLICLFARISYRNLKIIFYAPLILLICFTLFDRRGIAGSSEINTYVALVVIALTMHGKDPQRFSLALLVGVFVSLAAVEWKHHFIDSYTDYSKSTFNWVFMATCSLMVTYYGKWLFDMRKRKLQLIKQELSDQNKILEASSLHLLEKTDELEKLTATLESKVQERTQKLGEQKKAMKDYLDLTLQELQIEYEGFTAEAQQIASINQDPICEMILRSDKNLKKEIDALLEKIGTDR